MFRDLARGTKLGAREVAPDRAHGNVGELEWHRVWHELRRRADEEGGASADAGAVVLQVRQVCHRHAKVDAYLRLAVSEPTHRARQRQQARDVLCRLRVRERQQVVAGNLQT